MKVSNFLRTLVTVITAVGLVGTSACTSLHDVAVPNSEAQMLSVKVGQRVRVTDKVGDRHSFKVTAIEADALRGAAHRVSYNDIALLEVRQFDKRKTIVLVSVVAGVVLYAAYEVLSGYNKLLYSY